MGELEHCGNCAFLRRHEEMGQVGFFCHAEPPKIQILPGGQRIVSGKPELQGLQLLGMWPPVDTVGGWCGRWQLTENGTKITAQ